jgi:hypothetical protein
METTKPTPAIHATHRRVPCPPVVLLQVLGALKGGMAPIYGLAGGLPDRGAVGDVLKGAQDIMLDFA